MNVYYRKVKHTVSTAQGTTLTEVSLGMFRVDNTEDHAEAIRMVENNLVERNELYRKPILAVIK